MECPPYSSLDGNDIATIESMRLAKKMHRTAEQPSVLPYISAGMDPIGTLRANA
ncbi:MAG: hypothetical protein ACI9IV_001856 [Paracoccaceae bacterium]|jgi:hypothetical protein